MSCTLYSSFCWCIRRIAGFCWKLPIAGTKRRQKDERRQQDGRQTGQYGRRSRRPNEKTSWRQDRLMRDLGPSFCFLMYHQKQKPHLWSGLLHVHATPKKQHFKKTKAARECWKTVIVFQTRLCNYKQINYKNSTFYMSHRRNTLQVWIIKNSHKKCCMSSLFEKTIKLLTSDTAHREREYTKVYLQSGLQISSILQNKNTDQKEYIGEQKTTSIRELRVGFYTGICDE